MQAPVAFAFRSASFPNAVCGPAFSMIAHRASATDLATARGLLSGLGVVVRLIIDGGHSGADASEHAVPYFAVRSAQ